MKKTRNNGGRNGAEEYDEINMIKNMIYLYENLCVKPATSHQ